MNIQVIFISEHTTTTSSSKKEASSVYEAACQEGLDSLKLTTIRKSELIGLNFIILDRFDGTTLFLYNNDSVNLTFVIKAISIRLGEVQAKECTEYKTNETLFSILSEFSSVYVDQT